MTVTIYNILTNPGFNTLSDWGVMAQDFIGSYSDGIATQTGRATGTSGIVKSFYQTPVSYTVGHKYYFRLNTKISIGNDPFFSERRILTNNVPSIQIASNAQKTNDWVTFSSVGTATEQWARFQISNVVNSSMVWQDVVMQHTKPIIVDLTTAFGDGNEPDQVWCDENIPFFSESYLLFDPLDDEWWIENTGCDENALNPANDRVGSVTYDVDTAFQNGTSRRSQEAIDEGCSENVRVANATLSFDNCKLNTSVTSNYVQATYTTSKAFIDHCTFDSNSNIDTAISGMGLTIRNNYITSNTDGIVPRKGFTLPSVIEYNRIDGPGRVPGNHMDGIQFVSEGNGIIRRNKIGGYTNACIIIKSDVQPQTTEDPITNVLIEENYFTLTSSSGAAGIHDYYLMVLRNTDEQNTWNMRPRYITIRNNWFESNSKYAILTHPSRGGFIIANLAQRAMFVRTEEERNQGVINQTVYPAVLQRRIATGYHESAVDARSWIVWNGNRYADSGLEVEPTFHRPDLTPGMTTWYDISAEGM